MKRYLLDTSLVAAFLHGRKHVIELIDPWVRKQEVATSILVYGEVTEYLKGLADYSRYQARLLRLFTLEQFTPYPLTYPILEREEVLWDTEGELVSKADHRKHPILRRQPFYFTRAHLKREC